MKKKKAKPTKKKQAQSNRHNAGRKLFDGKNEEIVIQKLEYVWAIGGSDAEAAFYAEISKAALSDYLKKNKKISERKASLLETPTLKARQEIIKGLEGNPEFSLKYLERKKSAEFSLKTQTELSGAVDNNITHDISKAIEGVGFRDIRDLIKSIKGKSGQKSSLGSNRRRKKGN